MKYNLNSLKRRLEQCSSRMEALFAYSEWCEGYERELQERGEDSYMIAISELIG